MDQIKPVKKKLPSKPFTGVAAFVSGIVMMLFCSGLIVTYTAEIIVGETKHGVSSQLGLIVFLAGLVFVGWKLVQGRLVENKAVRELQEEQLILSKAKTRGQALTVSETALECQLSISETKKAFERLALTGVCQIDVTDEGELCYNFPSLRPKNQPEEDHILGINFEPARQLESKNM